MRALIGPVKLVHSILFFVLSASILYTLYCGVLDRVTPWTWAAMALVVVEGVVLAAFGWRCPLTLLAERWGAENGAVADLYLPKWFADRLFGICGALFAVGVASVLIRVLHS